MEVSALLDLIAEGKVVNAKYLPMEAHQFLIRFGDRFESKEITHALLGETTDGADVVVAFIMNGELYQSDLPQYQPQNTVPELALH